MTSEGKHPDKETLDAFGQGRLSDADISRVSEHLDSCEQCSDYLSQAGQDTVLDHLAAIGDSSESFLLAEPQAVNSSKSFEDLQETFSSHSRYALIRPLGSGGMGAVFLASHSVMQRQVAIKVINDQFVSNPDAVKRFFQEVRNASLLSHKNIVTAHDADSADDIHFLVMEYVEGESLAEAVARKGRLPVVHSCNYIRQAAAGLKHAASRNMVHRDIKPQNIMLTAGGVIKILDFGLARLTERGDADEGLTSTGVLMGTADFIAPEQARDARNADLKSDIYSLGCTLYFLLVGQPPFPGGTYVEKVIAHCSEPFPDIRRIRDDVPDEVCTIISRMTAREPGERYQTARELIEALTPFSQRTDKSIKTGTAGPPPNGGNAVGVEHDETKIEQRSPIPNVISKETPSASGSKASIPIIGAALAGFLLLCGVVWIFAGDFFPGSEPVQPQAGGSDVYVPESDAPHVLIVLSADKFWYSDFGPLQQTLQENNFRWTVTSNRSGQASYDRTDSIPGKQDVSIEQSIVDLSNGDGLSEFDAIVFMGNSIEEFIADDDVGVAVADVLNKLDDGNAWITGIGRGVNIPAYHGFYDGDEIADSQWIIPAARQASEFIGINERVVVDEDARVLTAREWHDATDFARQLVTQLRSSHLNR